MEVSGRDSKLRDQESKAEVVVTTLAEDIKPSISSILDLQKQRNTFYLAFEDELQKLNNKYDAQYSVLFAQRSDHVKNLPGFWLKVLQQSQGVSSFIFEQDVPLLQQLVDIRYTQDTESDSFKLEFEFSENAIMQNTLLTKEFIIKDNEIEKSNGTEIVWKGANLTQKTKNIKAKGKKGKVTNKTKIVDRPSFFSFFKSRNPADEESIESDEEEDMEIDPIEDEMDMGYELRDELIPNAVFYYLGVKKGCGSDCEEDECCGENKPVKVDGSGAEKPECKQQ